MNKKESPTSILNLLGSGTAISLLGDATLYTVLPHPEISGQLGITLSMVGVLLGANRAVRLVANSPVGILFDRMPRRGLLIAALAAGAFSSLFYAVGYGFWPLLIGRISWGLSWSMLWVGGNSVVLDISTEENRGKHSGIYQMWFVIGVAASSLMGSLLTDLFGFRTGQWISAGVIAGAALSWFFYLPETRKSAGSIRKRSPVDSEIRDYSLPWKMLAGASGTLFITRFLIWGVLSATAILWLSGLVETGVQVASIFIPIATLTGLYTALSSLFSIPTPPLVGLISDRFGRRWPLITGTMILGSLGFWLMSGNNLSFALVGAFLVPAAGSSTEALIPAAAGDRVPAFKRSRALGLLNTAGDLGAALGPFAALAAVNSGWLEIGGVYRGGSVLFGAAAVLAVFQMYTTKGSLPVPEEPDTVRPRPDDKAL